MEQVEERSAEVTQDICELSTSLCVPTAPGAAKPRVIPGSGRIVALSVVVAVVVVVAGPEAVAVEAGVAAIVAVALMAPCREQNVLSLVRQVPAHLVEVKMAVESKQDMQKEAKKTT